MSFISVLLRACAFFCLVVLGIIVATHDAIRAPFAALSAIFLAAFFWEAADTDWSDDDSEEGKPE